MQFSLKALLAAALIDDGWNMSGGVRTVYENTFKAFIERYMGGWDRILVDPQISLSMRMLASQCRGLKVQMAQNTEGHSANGESRQTTMYRPCSTCPSPGAVLIHDRNIGTGSAETALAARNDACGHAAKWIETVTRDELRAFCTCKKVPKDDDL